MTVRTDVLGEPLIAREAASSIWRDTLGNILRQRSAIVGLVLLGFLLLVFKEPPRSLGESSDQLWHRWEEGDITRYEFERLRRAGQTHLGARGAGN